MGPTQRAEPSLNTSPSNGPARAIARYSLRADRGADQILWTHGRSTGLALVADTADRAHRALGMRVREGGNLMGAADCLMWARGVLLCGPGAGSGGGAAVRSGRGVRR